MSDDHEIINYETDDIIEFTGVLHFDESQEQLVKVKEMAQLGNYLIYRRHNGDSACLTIMDFTHNPLAGTRKISCEDGALDLLNMLYLLLKPHHLNRFNTTGILS